MSPFRRIPILTLGIALLAGLTAAAGAQPFSFYLIAPGPTQNYVTIPHSTALNPTDAFTFEAWVNLVDSRPASGCSSIAGKNYLQAWWVGICGTSLRSYLKGAGSSLTGGQISTTKWTHIAVVFDGAQHMHYINGEMVASQALTGPLTTSTDPMRIASDVAFAFTPTGSIDEVRLWSVARTQDQIRTGLMGTINSATTGLQAVWHLDEEYEDPIGHHDGTPISFLFGSLPHFSGCPAPVPSANLCLNNRFLIGATFRTGAPGTAESSAQVVATPGPNSGLFWFFSSDNWEVLIKSINGCALNNRWWLFSAATTNVFYRVEVLDRVAGSQRIYFNYQGPPAPAVTDTSAFATCP
jgi:hypothetical protein